MKYDEVVVPESEKLLTSYGHAIRFIVSPQRSYVEILTPKVMVLGGGVFGR